MSRRIITLGTWDGKPIEWIVLKEEDFGTLIVSIYTLLSQPFNSASGQNTWNKSTIRKYLNSTFFDIAFNDLEKKHIINVWLDDVKSKDSVFLLNVAETKILSENDRKFGNGNCGVSCSFSRCHECYKKNIEGYSTCWLLRAPTGDNNVSRCILNGIIYELDVKKVQSHGIRPAMWIREK